MLRKLPPPDDGHFGWGYNGGGTSRTAAAILADALNVPFAHFWPGHGSSDLEWRLREAFCAEVLTHACDEWRLRRGAVLRWIRGWYAHHGLTEMPPAVATLPPIFSDTYLDAAPGAEQ